MAYGDEQELGIGGLLESIGGGLDPSFATNPYIPKAGSFAAGALSGFSSGRAARRRLSAANRVSAMEQKLGFPLDVLHRMSSDVQMSILKRAGLLGSDGTETPLESLGGFSAKQIMEEGAPASITTGRGEGSGIFEGLVGGEMSTGQRPAIPPLSMVPENQRSFYLSKLSPGGAGGGVPQFSTPADEALTRQRTLRGDVLEAQVPFAGQKAQLGTDLQRSQIRATDALTASRRQSRELSKQSSKGQPAPPELIASLRANGWQIPDDATPTYLDLDYYGRGKTSWGELGSLVDNYSEGFYKRIDSGKPVTEKDVREFAKTIKGELDLLGLRVTGDAADGTKMFINQVMDRIRQYQMSVRAEPPAGTVPEEPYTISGGAAYPDEGIEPELDAEEDYEDE